MSEQIRVYVYIFLLYSAIGTIFAFHKRAHKVHLQPSWVLFPLGAYVWEDTIIFGPFWIIATITTLFLNNVYFGLAFYFVFQTIRLHGETIYWFNQQFSSINRNPGKSQWTRHLFSDEYTGWFIYQILWQSLTAIAAMGAVYFCYKWLGSL